MNSFQGTLRERKRNQLSPKCQRQDFEKNIGKHLQPHRVIFLCFLGVFFIPICQSNDVETDGLILELSLEAELQRGSNIEGETPIWERNRKKKRGPRKWKYKVRKVGRWHPEELDSSRLSDQRLIWCAMPSDKGSGSKWKCKTRQLSVGNALLAGFFFLLAANIKLWSPEQSVLEMPPRAFGLPVCAFFFPCFYQSNIPARLEA